MRPSLAYLPSPSQGIWHLGPIPIRAYALCIIAGIVAAIWIGERRWVERGGQRGTVSDVAVPAVIFGLIGGRLYHVLTDPELYFGSGRHPIDAFKVWQGGLGIWGAISLGAVGAWIGCRRRGISLRTYADAVAPGVAVAQAIGRFGNWFNQELFGRPTTLPWGLKIDPGRPNTVAGAEAYQPTFLYEAIWDLGLAAALIWVDRRYRLGRGRVIALYIMGYPLGRIWIEALRIDTAHHFLGLRLNIWTSIVVFAGGLLLFLRSPGPRETDIEPALAGAAAGSAAETGADAGSAAEADADSAAEADEGSAAGAAEGAATEGAAAGATTEGAATEGAAAEGAAAEGAAAGAAAEEETASDADAEAGVTSEAKDGAEAESDVAANSPSGSEAAAVEPEAGSDGEAEAEAEPGSGSTAKDASQGSGVVAGAAAETEPAAAEVETAAGADAASGAESNSRRR